jgi:hypothetical protein
MPSMNVEKTWILDLGLGLKNYDSPEMHPAVKVAR